MSIVVEGVGTELITVDLYPATAPGQARGTSRVRIGVPEGAVTRLWTDETEAAWVRADVVAERSDDHVEVMVVTDAPETYQLACYCRWGENQVTVRKAVEEPIVIELDGQPTPAGTGLQAPRHGGPERAEGFIRVNDG